MRHSIATCAPHSVSSFLSRVLALREEGLPRPCSVLLSLPSLPGLVRSSGMFGPTLGFLLGSFCASLWVDIGIVDTGKGPRGGT